MLRQYGALPLFHLMGRPPEFCSSVQSAAITTPEPLGFEEHEDPNGHLLIWGTPSRHGIELDKAALETLLVELSGNAEKTLADINGSWALAARLSDDTAIFAVDRLGRVPLYVLQLDECQCLAGPDLGALRDAAGAYLSKELELDPQAVYTYVYHHMVPAPFASEKDACKLRGGEYRKAVPLLQKPLWYWTPDFSAQNGFSLSSSREELFSELRNALQLVVPKDKTCAAFLSGGLDSSTVVGLLSETSPESCHAYSIGFEAPGYDEMAYARITAEHFGAQLHEYYVTPSDVLDALPTLAASFSEPFGNSSALPAYFCARRAAMDGVEVLLAGDGGDELFAGNQRYSQHDAFDWYLHLPAFARAMLRSLVQITPNNVPLASKAKSFLRQAHTPMPKRMFHYSFLEQNSPDRVFSPRFLALVDTQAVQRELSHTWQRANEASSLNHMLALDWQLTLADNDLRKVNRASGLAGVEVRYPMLDDGVLALAMRIPAREKLRRGDLRRFYRSAMTGWLPQATLDKNKQGFGLPFGLWMREYKPLRDFASMQIEKLKVRGIFQHDFLEDTIRRHSEEHAAYYGELMWILCTLELWLNRHYPEYGYD